MAVKLADVFVPIRPDMKGFDVEAKKGATAAGGQASQSFAAAFKKTLTAANIGMAIGAVLGTGGIGLLKVADRYKRAMDIIRIGTGATGEALADLEKSFGRVAAKVPDDIETVAQVVADLNTRTGQTGDSLEGLAKQILDLSRITKTDAATNVAAMTRLFGDWSVASEDQAEALDKVFRAAQATGIGVDTLAQQMVQFGAPLRNIGYDFEQGAAMLAKWEREGVNTTLALGGLKIALGSFAKEGKDAKEGLAELVAQIENAETAAEAMALGVSKFGSRAGPDMVAAILEGRFAFEDLTEGVRDGTETITAATEATEDWGDKFSKLKNQVSVAVGPIVKDLAGIGDAMGNLVFLLPAMTGALGRGLGAAWTKAGMGPAVRAAAMAAGAAAGGLYSAAMAAGAKISAAISGALIALGAPGSALMAKAGILGQVVGTRITLGVVAGLALLPVITEAINAAIASTLPAQAMDAVNAQSLDLLAKARKFKQDMEAERLAVAQQIAARAGERSVEFTELKVRLDDLMMAGRVLHEGTKEQIEYLVNNGIPAYKEWAASTAAVEEEASGLEGELARLDAELAAVDDDTEGAADAMGALSLAIGGTSSRFKDLRQSMREADKAWESLLKSPDENAKSLKALNREIKEWETRYLNALRRGDEAQSEFALSQLQALEAERKARRESKEGAKEQREDIKAVSKTLGVSMKEASRLYRQHGMDLDTTLEKGKKLDGLDPTIDVDVNATQANRELNSLEARLERFKGTYTANVLLTGGKTPGGGKQHGGHVERGVPYVVGEVRPEIFVPNESGWILPDAKATMGSISAAFRDTLDRVRALASEPITLTAALEPMAPAMSDAASLVDARQGGGTATATMASGKLDVYVHDQDGGMARAGMSVSELADGIASILRADRGGTRYSWGGG